MRRRGLSPGAFQQWAEHICVARFSILYYVLCGVDFCRVRAAKNFTPREESPEEFACRIWTRRNLLHLHGMS